MRILSLLIAIICLGPVLLVFGGWVLPLSMESLETWVHIRETVLTKYFFGSFSLMFLVALLAGSMGGVCAYVVTRFDFPLRGLLAWALILPFAMPSYILAMSFGNIFEFAGPVQSFIRDAFSVSRGEYWFPYIRSIPGAALMLALSTYPYVYLSTQAALRAQPAQWAELASSYGHSGRFGMLRISLSAARPAIMVGIALCVIEAAADIGVAQLFGVPTLATGLYRIWYFGSDVAITARLASLLVLVAMFLLFIERASRKRARFTSTSASNPIARTQLLGWKKWLATFFTAAPLFFGFVLPLIWTLRLAFFNNQHLRVERIIDATFDSLLLCVIGASATILLALIVNMSERQNPNKVGFQWLASIGYAVPGIVIALSLLVIQKLTQDHLSWHLIMTGSVFGMILAYSVRFFAPAYQSISVGFNRIPEEMDMMAKTFGKSNLSIFGKIHLPLLRLPLFHGFLLVAIDIFKELPASLILRPFDITTLAIAVFEFAGDDRPAEAAPYALILIGVATLSIFFYSKLQRSEHD